MAYCIVKSLGIVDLVGNEIGVGISRSANRLITYALDSANPSMKKNEFKFCSLVLSFGDQPLFLNLIWVARKL